METKEIAWIEHPRSGGAVGKVNGLLLFDVCYSGDVKETPYAITSHLPGLRKRYARDIDHAKQVAKEMLQSFVKFVTLPPTPIV